MSFPSTSFGFRTYSFKRRSSFTTTSDSEVAPRTASKQPCTCTVIDALKHTRLREMDEHSTPIDYDETVERYFTICLFVDATSQPFCADRKASISALRVSAASAAWAQRFRTELKDHTAVMRLSCSGRTCESSTACCKATQRLPGTCTVSEACELHVCNFSVRRTLPDKSLTSH